LIVLLDSSPLGPITNPRLSPEAVACNEWLESLLRGGARILVPEIADYEVRRELLRAGKLRGIRRLDRLGADIGYLPLTTAAMLSDRSILRIQQAVSRLRRGRQSR
jgi:predicted nucleic acid-binding protein